MGFIMTAEGHLLFSIACAVFAKNAELTPVLAQGDWWHIVPSAILTCLLPDIDHPRSFLGQRLSWLSKTHCPNVWPPGVHSQPAGGVCCPDPVLPESP
ncbi:Inner membrane protein ydjM [Kluyvera cryocrescens]|uniref:Inner membrane protein ydjM n=1 Tax=Kluyvera cryocrescens TaxID=580 RepID=A0A485A5Q6_KLUCR|nr:Inner membrane protein ydjM [Kluyvera cryocrescens]